jgi:hypothetical protein
VGGKWSLQGYIPLHTQSTEEYPRSYTRGNKVRPGDLVGVALYQSNNRTYNSERERIKAWRERKRAEIERDYSWVGEWTLADEVPWPDEEFAE